MTKTGRRRPREVLTVRECRQILATFGKGPTQDRNRALVVVWWRAGLRLQESLDLELRDVNAQDRTLHVRHGKGDQSRLAKLDVEAWAVLETWLAAKAKLPRHPKYAHLFVTCSGRPLTQQYCRQICKRAAARAGIEKRVHPHGFRHTFAEHLARDGAAFRDVQAGLGHQKASTTDIYLRELRPTDYLEAVDKRPSWREDED